MVLSSFKMKRSLVAVIHIVNVLFSASCASAETAPPKVIGEELTSVFEAYGYTPPCVASAMAWCQFSSKKNSSIDVVDSIELTKSFLQEMKSEREDRKEVKKTLIILMGNLEEMTRRVSNFEVLQQKAKAEREKDLAITMENAKVLAAIMVSLEKMNPKKNCAELRVLGAEMSEGVQTVYPYGFTNPKPVVVFCEQVTDGGGWTVIQSRSRLPNRENFTRNWDEYVKGFGDPMGEFWLGLDNIHALTNSAHMELRVDLVNIEGEKAWALYRTFHVGDAASEYVLSVGGYFGVAGDGMASPDNGNWNLNQMKFSTYDNDNDLYSESNCAEDYKGGWWFNRCSGTHLNGVPIVRKVPKEDGIIWYPFHNNYRPMKKATMKIRPVFQCGKSQFTKRIVGGKNVAVNEYPWVAALIRKGSPEPNHHCGGSLISNKHVLTAAHCLHGFAANTITVRLGEHDFSTDTESQHKNFKIAAWKIHDKYDNKTIENDIAIITLDKTVDFNKRISPICLPPQGDTFEGQLATVVGWGKVNESGPVSNVLRKVSLPVISNEDCFAAYESKNIFPSNICAHYKAGGKDSCEADSGGPLMLPLGREDRWSIIGLVSWGYVCGSIQYPGVYARVSEYLPWIYSNNF